MGGIKSYSVCGEYIYNVNIIILLMTYNLFSMVNLQSYFRWYFRFNVVVSENSSLFSVPKSSIKRAILQTSTGQHMPKFAAFRSEKLIWLFIYSRFYPLADSVICGYVLSISISWKDYWDHQIHGNSHQVIKMLTTAFIFLFHFQ